jgi:hypothetical protein
MMRVGGRKVGMSWPTISSDAEVLRALVIGTGACWSLAFVAIALGYELQLYADGAMFSYAVAVQDVWAFHWHNISGRSSVFLLSLWPAEAIVGLTGSPWTGIVIYGLLFYLAPLVGLIGTFAADRSKGRILFAYACCSTALLCPLVFGFPTEMWLAHAIFWPALAVSHYAKRTLAGAILVLFLLLALAFTHEAGLVLAAATVATLALRGLRNGGFVRAAIILAVVLGLAGLSKMILPPDDYYAAVLLRAALHFFDLTIFEVNVVLLLIATLAGYGIVFVALSRLLPLRAHLYAAAIMIVLLSIYWLWFDHEVLASSRYYLRTALVILTPIFAALGTHYAIAADGQTVFHGSTLQGALDWLRKRAARPLAAAFVLVTLVHIIETAKFVAAWTHYRAAITALATGDQSDPQLGDPHFVSSQRAASDLSPLSWFSTTPYLSVIVANFTPKRLVIDPAGNYFWLSCATATQNKNDPRATPTASRDLIRIYSCLHR